ncbi:MAG: FAD:protein FMN transferase, partial [Planctomycetes bacterium]|nr:FAD:protein FMN transferase [Planctomycetota bacterium]
IVKGWAADRTAARLAGHTAALIDADGDIAVTGPRADGSPWPITIASPRPGDPPFGVLPLYSGGIATCAPDRRRWQQGERSQHHIIDPRTGAPAANDVHSATVVAPSASEAEAAAKAVVLLGSVEGLAWLERQPAYAGLIVRHDGELVRSTRLAAFAPADSFAPLP